MSQLAGLPVRLHPARYALHAGPRSTVHNLRPNSTTLGRIGAPARRQYGNAPRTVSCGECVGPGRRWIEWRHSLLWSNLDIRQAMSEPEDEQDHQDAPEVGLPSRDASLVEIWKVSRILTLPEFLGTPSDCSACCRKCAKRAGVHHSDSAVLALQDAQAPTPCVRKGAELQDGVFDHVEDALASRGAEGSDLSRCGTPQQQQGMYLLAPALLLSGLHIRI